MGPFDLVVRGSEDTFKGPEVGQVPKRTTVQEGTRTDPRCDTPDERRKLRRRGERREENRDQGVGRTEGEGLRSSVKDDRGLDETVEARRH